jgi:hypothetical protein
MSSVLTERSRHALAPHRHPGCGRPSVCRRVLHKGEPGSDADVALEVDLLVLERAPLGGAPPGPAARLRPTLWAGRQRRSTLPHRRGTRCIVHATISCDSSSALLTQAPSSLLNNSNLSGRLCRGAGFDGIAELMLISLTTLSLSGATDRSHPPLDTESVSNGRCRTYLRR